MFLFLIITKQYTKGRTSSYSYFSLLIITIFFVLCFFEWEWKGKVEEWIISSSSQFCFFLLFRKWNNNIIFFLLFLFSSWYFISQILFSSHLKRIMIIFIWTLYFPFLLLFTFWRGYFYTFLCLFLFFFGVRKSSTMLSTRAESKSTDF